MGSNLLPQICHAPLKKPTTDAEQVLWNRLQLERQQSAVLLENLLQQVSFKKSLSLISTARSRFGATASLRSTRSCYRVFSEMFSLRVQVQPPLLVRSLLLLQGPPASHAKIIRVRTLFQNSVPLLFVAG